jgi:dTDP-4-dehydrorhamnose 3,5-epimerase
MDVTELDLPGLLLFEPRVHSDGRGAFFESFHRSRYQQHLGAGVEFVQDNVSVSAKGVLRGMHLQHPHGQGKLVFVLAGEVLDVVVDVRVGSPHFGKHQALALSGSNRRQLYIPPGFAHGFLVLSDSALFQYKCTDYYHPESELSIRWDDPQLAIAWPDARPTAGAKDAAAPTLRELLSAKRLPLFTAGPGDAR